MTQKPIENISSKDLKNLVEQYGANKIFLVTGKGSYQNSGAQDFVERALESTAYVRFFEFEQNPKYEDVVLGTELFRESQCDIIIAIGGGSVIDMAKLINIFVANSEVDGLDIVKNSAHISQKGKPLIAIPTTAGTGSEATHFAVVYHNKNKYSVAHEYLLPEVAVLNHQFTQSQSAYLTACAGMDALSQAIESYWSVGSTKVSENYAEKAIRLLLSNLEKSVNTPDTKSRESTMKAAYLAGKAINITKTTAAHAVSYAFTTYYGIPHGHAVFLTLPEFFEYNYGVSIADLNDPRGVEHIQRNLDDLCQMFGVASVRNGKCFLKNLARDIGVELSLDQLKIADYEARIADNVNMERLGNNPRKISKEGLINLLKTKSN